MGDLSEKSAERVRAITQLYYSNPAVQKAIVEFSINREVVPRYFVGFGKRPDVVSYPNDIMGAVKKGATSFHCSEEIWDNPLSIDSDMDIEGLRNIRKAWDLLIDVDSQYLDYSKIATKLIIDELEKHGIKNYGLKFSVSGDTPLLIKDKKGKRLLPMENIIELVKKGHKLEILSLDSKRKLKFSKIYDFLEHTDKLYEITHSRSTIPIKATGHHSVFVWDKGEIIQKKVAELKKEDFLISFNSTNNHFSQKKIKIFNKFSFRKNQYRREIKPTKELMRLIGYFLAEGHVTNIINQVGFSFHKDEKEYIEDVKNLLIKITKRHISIRHPNPGSTQILIHSKEWASFFDNFCGKKKDKHVPEFSWDLPKNLFLEILKGYIRGDGYKIGKYSIVIKSVSKRLITEFVWLCKLNGISCCISSEQNKEHILPQGTHFKGSLVYIIRIPKSELEDLEFYRKRNKFSPFAGDRTFPIDGLKEVYKKIKPKLFNHHRAEQMTLKKKRSNLNRIRKVLDWFYNFNEKKEDIKNNKILMNYEKLFNSDISVVEIKNIIPKGKKKVYDVSVRGTESFFGNYYPILLHNSGSKGFHIIVSSNAFPKFFEGVETKNMFPEWPRAICEYIANNIKPLYNKAVSEKGINYNALEIRSKLKKEDVTKVVCGNCGEESKEGKMITLVCPDCGASTKRMNPRITKRGIRCTGHNCFSLMDVVKEEVCYYCSKCNLTNIDKMAGISKNKVVMEKEAKMMEENRGDFDENISDDLLGGLDLVLVASRHLFRSPYSLHEKTALASVVMKKDDLDGFIPKHADPLSVKIAEFMPKNEGTEGELILKRALEWKKLRVKDDETKMKKKYENYKSNYEEVKLEGVEESMFPNPIKKLLKGLEEGRKRGLFVLLTFLKSTGFKPDEINEKVREWNKRNKPPLKEGYLRSQIDWHLKQTKKILPPNYSNDNFYKDLKLIDKKPDVKNPLVEVSRKLRKTKFE